MFFNIICFSIILFIIKPRIIIWLFYENDHLYFYKTSIQKLLLSLLLLKYCILLIDSLILENIMDTDLIIFSKENKKVNIKRM